MSNEEPLVEFDDDDEPLLQHHLDEADSDSKDYHLPSIRTTSAIPNKTRRLTVLLVVTTAIALLIAVLALALSAAGLHKDATQSPKTSTVSATTIKLASCGNGLWKKVAYLNMTDPAQQCPRGWRGYATPVRCCGRPVSSRSSCPSVFYSTNGFKYSKVCGRAIGYQQGSPDGFGSDDSGEPQETLDGIYVDGVSVTHGNPRKHIWTFAAGLLENGNNDINNNHRCPCDGGQQQPNFIGNNSFFCETGDHDPMHDTRRFYDEDPLWDGQKCVNSTCCTFNNPPWFKVQLSSSTIDDIEVRICGDQSTGDEDTPIALLEIYIQQ